MLLIFSLSGFRQTLILSVFVVKLTFLERGRCGLNNVGGMLSGSVHIYLSCSVLLVVDIRFISYSE
jgi:hypothetical protein